MASKRRDEAERLRRQASMARRLASQQSQATDHKALLRYAGELEARAERLECGAAEEG